MSLVLRYKFGTGKNELCPWSEVVIGLAKGFESDSRERVSTLGSHCFIIRLEYWSNSWGEESYQLASQSM